MATQPIEIRAKIRPHLIGLSGNPVLLELEAWSAEGAAAGLRVRLDMEMNGERVYSAPFQLNRSGIAQIDLHEIIAAYQDAPAYYGWMTEMYAIRPELFVAVRVTITAEDAEPVGCEWKGAYGRLDNRNVRHLEANHLGLVTAKFLDYNGNWTSSVRSNGTDIRLYESEVMPVMIVGLGDRIRIGGDKKSTSIHTVYLMPMIVNVAEYGAKSVWFRHDTESLGFTIDPDPDSEDPNLFEFRNCFGIFERFLATGTDVSGTATVARSESARSEPETGSYVSTGAAKGIAEKYEVQTGYLHDSSLNALKAMLCSEEIYWIREDLRERVLISCSEKLPLRVNEPKSYLLSVEPMETGSGYLPTLFYPTRLHNETFNETYN